MKDQIDVSVRRSPKYSVFMGIGAVLGVFVAGILAMFIDPARSEEHTSELQSRE